MAKFSLLLCIFFIIFTGCSSQLDKVKYQSDRSNIVDVKHLIQEIDFGEVLLSEYTNPYFVGDYLVMADGKSTDSIIHLFDRENYNYIVSTGHFGQGPSEIISIGSVIDNKRGDFYVTDFGKYAIMSFNIDSVIHYSSYEPKIKYNLLESSFPSRYFFISDTFSLGNFTCPTSISTYTESVGIWNMASGEIKLLEFDNGSPKKRISLAVSSKDKIYAECNYNYDLISIFDFEGNLLHNILGPNYKKEHFENFGLSLFTEDYLIVLYVGDYYENNSPRKYCQVFKKNGEYVATLDIGYNVFRFVYDEIKNRIVFCFINDNIQFGYLDLDSVFKNI